MNKIEIEEVLIKNGYAKHPVFKFYSIPKKNLGYYFYVNESEVVLGKINWNAINITEAKTVRVKSFDPHNYSLVTDMDRKQIAATMQRMAISRAKHKAALNKGYVEPKQVEEIPPATEE